VEEEDWEKEEEEVEEKKFVKKEKENQEIKEEEEELGYERNQHGGDHFGSQQLGPVELEASAPAFLSPCWIFSVGMQSLVRERIDSNLQ